MEENKEITRLKDLNRTLDERNRELQGGTRRLEDENRDLHALNSTLDSTNAGLRQRIDELVHSNEQLNTQLLQQQQQQSQSNVSEGSGDR